MCKCYSIYEINPAPWGDDYRFVESFETRSDACMVLTTLEAVNVNFNTYKIVEWEND